MNIAAVRKYCAALPHSTGDIKWGADHVYSIGAKMFCVSYEDGKGAASVSFKVDDDLFLQYRSVLPNLHNALSGNSGQ